MENINYNAFEEMTNDELNDIDGGAIPVGLIIEGIKWVYDNRDTISRGLVDGWNSVNPA